MRFSIKQFFISFLFLTITLGSCGDFKGNYEEVENSVSNTTDNNTTESVKFVAVGSSGFILTSPDGTSWTSKTSGTSNSLRGITYGNSTFVTVGDSGSILTSSNGTSWTSRTSGTSNQLEGITYRNSTFVTVGSDTILTSTDRTSWTSRTFGDGTHDNDLVETLDSTRVAVTNFTGSGSTVTATITITDWSNISDDTYFILKDANGVRKTFNCGGTGASGTDHDTWMKNEGNNTVADNIHSMLNKTGNEAWTVSNPPANVITITRNKNDTGTSNQLEGINYGNSIFVVLGNSGTILTSSNGTSWSSRTSGTSNGLEQITYGNSTFVVVGSSGTILTSSDGISWTSRTSGTSNGLEGIIYGNITFVAVGSSGTILTSSDGTSWTSRTSGTSNSLQGISYKE